MRSRSSKKKSGNVASCGAEIVLGDCLEVLRTMPDESVHCCVTSPPYFGLRNYGIDGQIGLENTPQLFIAKMVKVFEEVRRVLRSDGVLFLNLGDSYAGSWGNYGGQNRGNGSQRDIGVGSSVKDQEKRNGSFLPPTHNAEGFKPKDLMLMPHRVAIALQEAGWWVRSDMPWVKRSAMPESVTDRPAKALEYVFMLTKSAKYFFDMEAVRVKSDWDRNHTKFPDGWDTTVGNGNHGSFNKEGRSKGLKTADQPASWKGSSFTKGKTAEHQLGRAQKDRDRSLPSNRNGITEHLDNTASGSRNFRNADLWYSSVKEPHGMVGIDDELVGLDVNPSGFSEAHFATFPPKLIEPLILAGTSEYGCCAACGAQYQRDTSIDYTNPGNRSTNGPRSSERKHLPHGTAGYEQRLEKITTTVGWQKTCKCKTDEIEPCIVLDPFSGAGTTGLVALMHRRRYLGIELNPKYIKIAEKRLRELQVKLF